MVSRRGSRRSPDIGASQGPLVFISHAGEDTWVARQLASAIEQCGARTFLDVLDIQLADTTDLDEKIRRALGEASELVILMSPAAVGRPWVWIEIALAHFRAPPCPIVVLLLGMSRGEFMGLERVPAFLKTKDILPLNDVERYLRDLATRIGENRNAPE